ncbi:MAG: 2-amino-4-hydroxy-6-hydroxymethyldihydropteridine diphosphokinase [Chloroflexi bacterium]|nr:2-amino-4-hydroxy-6-hydroxymethyldihydropteridine diphosphokinase [Chloroflexota bacterium]
MATAYLSLGANVGNREGNLRMALRLLSRMCRLEAVSSLFETQPVGGPEGQPLFYNAACRVETGLEPKALLRFLKDVEHEIGRRPGGPEWGPRPIDVDILLYDDAIVEEEELALPHPRLAERAFVLVPLAEIAADVRHPATGRPVEELRQEIDDSGIKLIAPPGWEGEIRPRERLRL